MISYLNKNDDMIQPKLFDYDLHKDVVAFSTTRRGGFSTGAYGEFNINRYCGDNAETIGKNRALLCQQLGISDVTTLAGYLIRAKHYTGVCHKL